MRRLGLKSLGRRRRRPRGVAPPWATSLGGVLGLLAAVGGAAGDFERMRTLTNNFTQITSTRELTVYYKNPFMLPMVSYTVDGNVLAVVPKGARPGQFPEHLVEDLKLLNLMDRRFTIQLGDTEDGPKLVPTLVKARHVGDRNAILYPINLNRHYPSAIFDEMALHDVPFKEKKSTLVWRGSTTGSRTGGYRFKLMDQYFDADPRIDVGFNVIVEDMENCTKWLKNNVRWIDMIKYKYILSIEGNDVSSGLKWQLYSNSVVFMPPPTKETWFLESRLVPYVHFIPVHQNLTNLAEQFEWAEAHPAECEAIAANSTQYANDVYHKYVIDVSERHRLLQLALGVETPAQLYPRTLLQS